MKRFLIVLTALLVLGAPSALAAGPVAFNVSITLRQAISITKVTDLSFGTIETGLGSYSVTAASGSQTGAGTGAAAASFTIQGESSAVADVSFGANPVTVTCSAPCSGSLSVTLVPEATTHTFTGAAETFYVGGTVSVAALDPAGVYTGSASISMIYQ